MGLHPLEWRVHPAGIETNSGRSFRPVPGRLFGRALGRRQHGLDGRTPGLRRWEPSPRSGVSTACGRRTAPVSSPIAWGPALERIPGLGTPAGVIQLIDRHERDCGEVAAHFGVPHIAVPVQGVPASGLEVVTLVDWRFWREVAVWVPRRQTLVCGDSLGTASYFRAGVEPLGVHTLLRLKPPRALDRYEPQHVLCGHGAGAHGPETADALREALRTARRRLPHALVSGVKPN